MPQLVSHGVDIYYRDEGEGVPIILGHSSTGSGGQWRKLIDRLSERYRLLAPDHLGYGRSGAYPGEPSLLALEVSIIEALIELAGAPVHLIGHSYGGNIIARAAARAPDRLLSLSLIEPTMFHLLRPAGRNDEHSEIKAVGDRVIQQYTAGDPEEAARGFIDYWIYKGAYDAMDEHVKTAVTACMPKLAVEFPVAYIPDGATPDLLAAIRAPIQLICAAETTPAARAVIDILQAIWPTARYSEVDGAGHMSPLTHANQVNAILENFLKQN